MNETCDKESKDVNRRQFDSVCKPKGYEVSKYIAKKVKLNPRTLSALKKTKPN